MDVGPILEPRPLARGVGEVTRTGGASTLAARILPKFFGTAGTGGASTAAGTGVRRPFGEGLLKVLSVMEPELPLRCSCELGRTNPDVPLVTEEIEPLRCVRFV